MSAAASRLVPGPDPENLRAEYQALLEFLHLAPVGLVRTRSDGEVLMMNPQATQLLGPLGFGDGDSINLLEMLDRASPDVRMLVHGLGNATGTLCEGYRVNLPPPPAGAAGHAPVALGVTVLRLPSDPDTLMVVLTDESAAVKLQRLQASWLR